MASICTFRLEWLPIAWGWKPIRVAASHPPARHYLTVLEDRPGLREAYKRTGYRLDDTETLMACDLAVVPAPALEYEVTMEGEMPRVRPGRSAPEKDRTIVREVIWRTSTTVYPQPGAAW